MVTVQELRKEGTKHNIKGRSSMNKTQLCSALAAVGVNYTECTKGAKQTKKGSPKKRKTTSKKSPKRKSPVKKRSPKRKSPLKKHSPMGLQKKTEGVKYIKYVELHFPEFIHYENGKEFKEKPLKAMTNLADEFVYPRQIYKFYDGKLKLRITAYKDLIVGGKAFDEYVYKNVVYITPELLKELKKFKYQFVQMGTKTLSYDSLGRMITTQSNHKPKVGEIWSVTSSYGKHFRNLDLTPYINYPHTKEKGEKFIISDYIRITKVIDGTVYGELLQWDFVNYPFKTKDSGILGTTVFSYVEPTRPIKPEGKKVTVFRRRIEGFKSDRLLLLSPYDLNGTEFV